MTDTHWTASGCSNIVWGLAQTKADNNANDLRQRAVVPLAGHVVCLAHERRRRAPDPDGVVREVFGGVCGGDVAEGRPEHISGGGLTAARRRHDHEARKEVRRGELVREEAAQAVHMACSIAWQ